MHYKDSTRETTDPKPGDGYYRLFGIDESGNTYFYWSSEPGEYAGYLGPNSPNVWGTLTCKNNMLPKHKVFIEDLEMVRKLECFDIMMPCGNCNPIEYKKWKAENEDPQTKSKSEPETQRRVYEELRAVVERERGTMEFVRKGAPQGGKWIVVLDGQTSEFFSNGAGFPELDNLYKPHVENPRVWQDYSLELIPHAKEIFLRMIR